MPRKGYKAVTISEDCYNRIQQFIWEKNAELGYKRYRSVAHLIEEAVIEYLKAKGFEVKKGEG